MISLPTYQKTHLLSLPSYPWYLPIYIGSYLGQKKGKNRRVYMIGYQPIYIGSYLGQKKGKNRRVYMIGYQGESLVTQL
jgi:hypothetical protein